MHRANGLSEAPKTRTTSSPRAPSNLVVSQAALRRPQGGIGKNRPAPSPNEARLTKTQATPTSQPARPRPAARESPKKANPQKDNQTWPQAPPGESPSQIHIIAPAAPPPLCACHSKAISRIRCYRLRSSTRASTAARLHSRPKSENPVGARPHRSRGLTRDQPLHPTAFALGTRLPRSEVNLRFRD